MVIIAHAPCAPQQAAIASVMISAPADHREPAGARITASARCLATSRALRSGLRLGTRAVARQRVNGSRSKARLWIIPIRKLAAGTSSCCVASDLLLECTQTTRLLVDTVDSNCKAVGSSTSRCVICLLLMAVSSRLSHTWHACGVHAVPVQTVARRRPSSVG